MDILCNRRDCTPGHCTEAAVAMAVWHQVACPRCALVYVYVPSDRLSCYCCHCDEEPSYYILLHTCVLAPSLDIRFGEIVLPPLPVWAEGSVQCSIVYVYNTLQCNTVQCNAIQCGTMQYSTIQCNTVQYNAMGTTEQLIYHGDILFHFQISFL